MTDLGNKHHRSLASRYDESLPGQDVGDAHKDAGQGRDHCAVLDIGKAELVCCARVPHDDQPWRRLQEVETYSTMTRPLLGMADHLRCLGESGW